MNIIFGGSGSVGSDPWNPFSNSPIHPISVHSTPINILNYHLEPFKIASGFYLELAGKNYLISNWHVFSGRDFFTRDIDKTTGFVPKNFALHTFFALGAEAGDIQAGRQNWHLSLTDDEIERVARPPIVDGVEIDVSVYELPMITEKTEQEVFRGSKDLTLGYVPIQVIAPPVIGDEVFVVGYPLSKFEGLMTPIWKRGTIANEPSLSIRPQGAFLVDVNTTSGMSGAPIVLRQSLVRSGMIALGGTNKVDIVIGIYSGRVLTADKTSQDAFSLGYGWTIDKILRIINTNQTINSK